MKPYICYEFPNTENREHVYAYAQRLLEAINDKMLEPKKQLSITKEEFLTLKNEELDDAMDEICCARNLYEHIYYKEKDCLTYSLITLLQDMKLTITPQSTNTMLVNSDVESQETTEFNDFQELLTYYIPIKEKQLFQHYKNILLKYRSEMNESTHTLQDLFEIGKQNNAFFVYDGIGCLYLATHYHEISFLKERDFIQSVFANMQTE